MILMIVTSILKYSEDLRTPHLELPHFYLYTVFYYCDKPYYASLSFYVFFYTLLIDSITMSSSGLSEWSRVADTIISAISIPSTILPKLA